jgi:hypothetical protein
MSRNVLAKTVRRAIWIGALNYYGYDLEDRVNPSDKIKVQAEFLRRIRALKVKLYTTREAAKERAHV